MDPGRDGVPWFLCSKCWLEGVRPANQFGAEPIVPVLERDDPKAEVGDFSRPKRRRAR